MGLRQIRFTLTAGTLAIGPYNLYANSVSSNNLIASNISLTSLQSGVIYTLDDTINTFVIYNNSCNTSQNYSVPAISPSITPTITPTRTPTITPTITATPSITPTVTITPTATPSITPSPSYVASNFGSGFQDDCVAHILVNDKITATGFITSYNGVAKDSYVQLNLNGTVNTSFVNYSNDGLVLTAAYNPTTSQYILGGYMYSWNGGSVAAGMVSLDPTTGARNETFNTNLGYGFNSNVRSIDIQSGGAIIAVGDFTTVNNIARNRIARININGTVDSSFSYNSNNISAVYRARVFSDDRIFICADVTNYDGTAVSNALWLQPDGTLYTQMGIGFTEYFGSTLDVRETNDGTGRIIVGGAFRKFNNNISRGIVRLNPDGSQDLSFTSPFTSDTSVEGLAVRSDGKVIIVGSFTNKIACLNDDGSIDTLSYSFGTGLDSQYGANISILENNDLIITGCFTSYNGTSANRIVRITANLISPSVSKTPSVTPTKTPSITITPTKTPSITPSITVSPSTTSTYSYTNLNYSNVSSTVVCDGGGTTGNSLFWINNATLTPGATVWSDSGLTTLAPSGYYGGGGYYLLVAANGIVSHTFIACPSPSVTPTVTPSITTTPSVTPSSQILYKYYFEMTGFNYSYTGGGIMTLNSTGGNASFNTNYNLILSQNSYNLSGTTVTADSGTNIQRIELIAYDGTTVVSTIYPGTTSYTFGTQFMQSTGTGAGQFQTIKVYFTPNPSPTPTITPTPTVTPSPIPNVIATGMIDVILGDSTDSQSFRLYQTTTGVVSNGSYVEISTTPSARHIPNSVNSATGSYLIAGYATSLVSPPTLSPRFSRFAINTNLLKADYPGINEFTFDLYGVRNSSVNTAIQVLTSLKTGTLIDTPQNNGVDFSTGASTDTNTPTLSKVCSAVGNYVKIGYFIYNKANNSLIYTNVSDINCTPA